MGDYLSLLDDSEGPAPQGAVKVVLQDHAGRLAPFALVSAHLSSGEGQQQEDERVQQVTQLGRATDVEGSVGGLRGWVEASAKRLPTILAMDANASPYGESAEGPSVWDEMRATGTMSSIWEGMVDTTQVPESHGGSAPEGPVSVNKMRGPE